MAEYYIRTGNYFGSGLAELDMSVRIGMNQKIDEELRSYYPPAVLFHVNESGKLTNQPFLSPYWFHQRGWGDFPSEVINENNDLFQSVRYLVKDSSLRNGRKLSEKMVKDAVRFCSEFKVPS